MQLKLPRPSRLFLAHPKGRAEHHAESDDPWAGEDAGWEAPGQGPESRTEVLRFFRGVGLAVLVGLAAWAAVVLVLLRLF